MLRDPDATGPDHLVKESLARLELIADTFLNLSTPIQQVVPEWLEQRHEIQQPIIDRCRTNLEQLKASPFEVLQTQAGWTALIRVPTDDETFCMDALEKGVLLNPGYLFDLPDNLAAVSLITPVNSLREGIKLL